MNKPVPFDQQWLDDQAAAGVKLENQPTVVDGEVRFRTSDPPPTPPVPASGEYFDPES